MKRTFLGSLYFFLLILAITLTMAPLPTNAAEKSEQKGSGENTDALSKENYVDRVVDEAWADTDPSGKEQKAPKTKEKLKKMHEEEEETAEDIFLY